MTYEQAPTIADGSGFLGRSSVRHLKAIRRGESVVVLTREPSGDDENVHCVKWDAKTLDGGRTKRIGRARAIVNVVGSIPGDWARTCRRMDWLRLRRHLGLIVAILAYLGAAAWMLPTYRWQINPDGVGYMTIARALLRGNFHDAINAYWSPLVSWLMLPLLACGVEPVLAFKLMSLGLGALGIVAAWWLMGNLRVPRIPRAVVVLALVPMMLCYALQVITSDLAAAVTILVYLAYSTNPRKGRRIRSGIVTGIWMGVAYLAKAYALWFVAAHYVLVTALDLYDQPGWQLRKNLIFRASAAMLVFLGICTAWAAVLTCKYGHFTYGSTGQYNWAYNGPDFRLPTHHRGLLAPPNGSAISAWDDATYLDVEGWNPLASERNWEHFRKNVQRNYQALVKLVESYSIFAWFILVGAMLVAGSRFEPTQRKPHAVLVVALLLYPCAYLLLHLEARFFWGIPILLVILSASVPAALGRLIRPRRWVGGLLLTFLASATFAYHAWIELITPKEVGKATRDAAEWIKPIIPAGARVASSEGWDLGLYIAFYDDLRYFGMIRPKAPPSEIKAQLDEHEIEYLLVTAGTNYPFLAGKQPLKTTTPPPPGRAEKMQVYRLR